MSFSKFQFRKFRSVADIPPEYIKRNVWLRGNVVEVREDHSLGVEHVPLFKGIDFWGQGKGLNKIFFVTVKQMK